MHLSKRIFRLILAVICLSIFLLPTMSIADPPGDKVFVKTTGDVVAECLGQTAAYTDVLYLDSPANSFGIIFDNNAPVGTSFDLGTFYAGTELVFRIHVNETGYDFFTGPGSRNPDGLVHAVAINNYLGLPNKTYVGFEDLFGGGDKDYDDIKFSVTVVPTPAPFFLIGSGIGAMALMRRMRRKDAAG
jgi:hypothetical protein